MVPATWAGLRTMLTYRGYWWLPETPGVRAFGVLGWDGEDTPYLDLDGHLAEVDLEQAFGGQLPEHEIILGLTVDGDVTCFQCMNVGRTLSLGGTIGSDRYRIL